jgi:hypothetical protein
MRRTFHEVKPRELSLSWLRRFLVCPTENIVSCPDYKIIKQLKTFHIQSISNLIGLKNPPIPAGILALPYHRQMKSSSPQRPSEDIKIIYAAFAGPAISEGFGKIIATLLFTMQEKYSFQAKPVLTWLQRETRCNGVIRTGKRISTSYADQSNYS